MQPRSGGKGEEFLLVVVLNADGDANVALLVITLDHHAYIRPDAILTHVAADIRFNILRDISQNRAQERILIVVPGSNGDSQIISYWICIEPVRSCIAENFILERLIQSLFSHCAELCVIGRLDALLLTDLGQYFLLFGWAAATAAGRQQGRAITPTRSRAANFFSFFIVKRLLSFQDFVDLSHFSAVFSHYRTGVVLALFYPTAVGFVN